MPLLQRAAAMRICVSDKKLFLRNKLTENCNECIFFISRYAIRSNAQHTFSCLSIGVWVNPHNIKISYSHEIIWLFSIQQNSPAGVLFQRLLAASEIIETLIFSMHALLFSELNFRRSRCGLVPSPGCGSVRSIKPTGNRSADDHQLTNWQTPIASIVCIIIKSVSQCLRMRADAHAIKVIRLKFHTSHIVYFRQYKSKSITLKIRYNLFMRLMGVANALSIQIIVILCVKTGTVFLQKLS